MFTMYFRGANKAAALGATLALALATGAAQAGEGAIRVVDPFARVASKMAKSGAAFMVIENTAAEDDRLVGVRSDVAERVELHTHIASGDGVMRMVEVPEGFVIPAGGSHGLVRGADHVMFLGLTRPLMPGDPLSVTLVFEKAGEVVVEMHVNNDATGTQMGADHGQMKGHAH